MKDIIHEAIKKKGFFFIAEIGQNHQGDVETFKKLIDMAKRCGADGVKSAKRTLANLPAELGDMPYLNSNSFGRTYREHREALELSFDELVDVRTYALSKGLAFGMSYTDYNSLLEISTLGLDFVKVPSSQITDTDSLAFAGEMNIPVVVSTGMSTEKDIDNAVGVLDGARNITLDGLHYYLMQCTSCYPCSESDLNLNCIPYMQKYYGPRIGFSGHHMGIDADMVARNMGAQVFERHITLSRGMRGTDHVMSLEEYGLARLIRNLSRYKAMLGTAEKKVLDCEKAAMERLRWKKN